MLKWIDDSCSIIILSFFLLRWSLEAEPLPFAPILVALHFAPSGTESGQLVKGPASLKLTKLEGLTERIRIGTTGRSYQMHKKSQTSPHCSKTESMAQNSSFSSLFYLKKKKTKSRSRPSSVSAQGYR